MAISQNLAFKGVVENDDEFPHPPGLSVVRILVNALKSSGWSTSEFENWRDCGWSFECGQRGATLLISLAQTEESNWMLQISPLRVRGTLAALFGAKSSAHSDDVITLARDVHSILSRQERIYNLRWRWDGYPDVASSTSEPSDTPSA
jgi:hypothetical protein